MDPSRISLRPFKLSDVDDFLKWASDDRVTRYLRWSSINSREEALTYLEKVAIHHPWRRSICLDDHSIGYISISPESGDDRCRARLGYALAAEFWGQGIATIALKMAVSSVFKELAGLVRVHAVVEVENKGSQRVLEKAGFLKEGLLRKYGYSILEFQHESATLRAKPIINTQESEASFLKSAHIVLQMEQTSFTPDLLKEGGDEFSDITLRPLDLSDIDDFMVWATDAKVSRFCSWEPYSNKEDALNYIKNSVLPHPWFKAYWGKGIATKAVKLVAKTIFTEWPHLERLEALVDVQNAGSQRVLEKAGFEREGVLRKYLILKGKSRDMVMFSLLSTDPQI
ncbi:hypothetical protein OIU76_011378 [Salix suchowensis]|nr:hypothetical protein OIU76_011378 [Salix suchowensis]